MSSLPPSPPDLYRVEHTPAGARLIPVTGLDRATHAGMALVRRLMDAHARDAVGLRTEVEQLRRQIQALEGDRARQQDGAERVQAAMQRLLAKNGALIAEKRRLRDALIGKRPLPNVHYRIDIDREGTARESTVMTLDTFPQRDHARAALAEAHRLAARQGGQVRQVRLDSVAWRAVIQRVVEE